VAGTVLALLVVLAVVAATRPTSQASEIDGPLVGKAAPTLAGATLAGPRFSLAADRGHYAYVNFFASWCGPCQTEAPALTAFARSEARSPGGARMVSVVYNDSDAAARSFQRQSGADWPTLSDPGGALAGVWGVTAPPTTFLVDPAGTVVGELVAPATASQLRSLLARARAHPGQVAVG
jgi:thiol-disulfide isomerase/thioredoxin